MFKKIVYVIIFLLFTLLSYKYFESHIFTFHFVDEDENIVAGYYMTKGEKLYKDIFSHKQPLPAIISMAEQKIQRPNSLYLLIKRHREMVYFHSIIWSLILICYFGLPGLIFSVAFEIIKQYQLGNLFLSESLVVFPVVFIIGIIWKILSKDNKISVFETLLFSLSLCLILFLQFTLIPLIFFVIFLLLFLKRLDRKIILSFSAILLVFLIISSLFINFPKYLENTVSAISGIYLGGPTLESPLKVLFYSFGRPIAILLNMTKSEFGVFSGMLALSYIASFIYLFIVNKSYRKLLIITYLILGLSSLRIVEPDKTFYSGFHGAPWLALFVWTLIYQLNLVISNVMRNPAKRNILSYILILLTIVLPFFYGKFMIKDYYRKSDRETDWYVNFSRFYDFGQTIRILSKPNDKLIVLPAEQLIYWQSGLSHATRFLYVYMFVDPKYKKELYDYWERPHRNFYTMSKTGVYLPNG